MTDPSSESNGRRALRWSVYVVLIALTLGQAAGKILAVNSVNIMALEKRRVDDKIKAARKKIEQQGVTGEELERQVEDLRETVEEQLRLQRPFLSGNDRSRWMAIRAIAENGSPEIDPFLEESTWDTIDMVQHRGRDGELHLYSSKPPLLLMLLAVPYWLLMQATGMTLGTHPYELGRAMLLVVNGGSLVVILVSVARIIERWGEQATDIFAHDFAKIFTMATAAFGTMLTAFTPVLNNHLIAAAAAAVACSAWSRLVDRQEPGSLAGTSGLAGFSAAFAVTNELPAMALLVFFGLSLLRRRPSETLAYFTPAVLIVAAAFFATNYWSHDSLRPPYAHRNLSDPSDNWYDYEYTVRGKTRDSYWRNPKGIDVGESSKSTYALHTLVGHHGIFSLTPVWALSLLGGAIVLLKQRDWRREFALITLAITVACLVFYIGMRPQAERNYGGATSAFRWLFWLAPMWLALIPPAVATFCRWPKGLSRLAIAICCALLVFSALSASYPTWNPWSQPWIYRWLEHLGFAVL